MKPEEIAVVAILTTWLGMLALEAAFPARSYPRVRGWRLAGALYLLGYFAVGTLVPLLLPERVFELSIVNGAKLGVFGGAAAGYLVVTFVGYCYHRACHRFDVLWRGLHQLHHSAPRLDIGGSMVFHPLEMAAYTLIQLGTAVALGLDPRAAAVLGYVGAFYSLFQHLNVRTPRWLGYFIQRPEAHGLHHERGVHASNYGDLPIWDVLFGTFRNPDRFEGEVGFGSGAHRRVLSMLIGRDVSGGTGTAALQHEGETLTVAAPQ